MHAPGQDGDIRGELYTVGCSLGLSLSHIRAVVERGENLRDVLRRWKDWQRESDRYIAASWPDYTSDAERRMPEEMPPMHETAEEQKARHEWLVFALGEAAKLKPGAKPERLPRDVNLRARCMACGAKLPGKGLQYCSDKCLLLDRNERSRA